MTESAVKPITYVYIDGFNLYYGSLIDSQYKWLNLQKLIETLLPKNDIQKIKYYTARVKPFPFDPDAPNRQDSYWRALRTLSKVQIIEGAFKVREKPVRLVSNPNKEVLAYNTTEKGSDVNLATDIVNDAHLGHFDVGVIVSNDSDLVNAVRVVKRDARKIVGVIRTSCDDRGMELSRYARFQLEVTEDALKAAQLPRQINIPGKRPIIKPSSW